MSIIEEYQTGEFTRKEYDELENELQEKYKNRILE